MDKECLVSAQLNCCPKLIKIHGTFKDEYVRRFTVYRELTKYLRMLRVSKGRSLEKDRN